MKRRGLFWITYSEPNKSRDNTIGGYEYFYEPLWYYLLRKLKHK